jgi:NAD(P)H-hydrate epimerase
MTRHPDTAEWIRRLLSTCTRPLLLDADALNAFEGHPEALAQAAGPLIITPHPAELARLLGCPTTDVQNDREGAAQRAAALTHAVVVLKGSGTLVVKEGKTIHVNLTGNAGMASGGMGDVLSGIIGGLLAQGIPPFDAACAGAFLHGRAGDNAAWRKSQSSLCATDVIEELPFVFRELVSR